MGKFSLIIICFSIVSLSSMAGADAAPLVGSSKLLSPNTPEYYNQFGGAVDISPDGRTALVGEHRETWSAGTGGNAYYFPTLSSTGNKFPPGDQIPQTAFGRAVALSDDGSTAVIGAPWNDNGSTGKQGAAYIYTFNGGMTLKQKLLDSDGGEYEYFGGSVDISDNGNTIIIGNSGDQNAAGTGAAHVYVRSGASWVLQQKLKASDGQPLDFFGTSVALSGDGNIAIVGAPFDNGDQGSVYVFVRSGETWDQQTRFTAIGGVPGDNFGTSVDLSDDGNTALVGAYWKGNLGFQRGAAYTFVRSKGAWSQQGMLLAPDGAPGDWFGNSVALSNDGNIAVIGAKFANAAYLYIRQGTAWSFQNKLSTNDQNAEYLGTSVAVSDDGGTVLVGDDEYTVSGILAQGAVFIFRPIIPMPGPNLLLLNSP